MKPIRTVEEFKASSEEWYAAMACADQSDDPEERRRAVEACIREEKRWDEARDLFAFDEDGNILDLLN